MNVSDALVSRYSVRAFRPDPIERELLLEIMKSAIHAPSWANTQPWEVFVAGGESLDRLRRGYTSRFDESAPPDPELSIPKEWPPSLKRRIGELVATWVTPGVAASDASGDLVAHCRWGWLSSQSPEDALSCGAALRRALNFRTLTRLPHSYSHQRRERFLLSS